MQQNRQRAQGDAMQAVHGLSLFAALIITAFSWPLAVMWLNEPLYEFAGERFGWRWAEPFTWLICGLLAGLIFYMSRIGLASTLVLGSILVISKFMI